MKHFYMFSIGNIFKSKHDFFEHLKIVPKGGLISESCSLWLQSPKKGAQKLSCIFS
jgi:hypothetical protein